MRYIIFFGFAFLLVAIFHGADLPKWVYIIVIAALIIYGLAKKDIDKWMFKDTDNEKFQKLIAKKQPEDKEGKK